MSVSFVKVKQNVDFIEKEENNKRIDIKVDDTTREGLVKFKLGFFSKSAYITMIEYT